MNDRDRRIVLAAGGLLLVAFGHKLFEAEGRRLGLPHVVAAALLTAALRA